MKKTSDKKSTATCNRSTRRALKPVAVRGAVAQISLKDFNAREIVPTPNGGVRVLEVIYKINDLTLFKADDGSYVEDVLESHSLRQGKDGEYEITRRRNELSREEALLDMLYNIPREFHDLMMPVMNDLYQIALKQRSK